MDEWDTTKVTNTNILEILDDSKSRSLHQDIHQTT